MQRAMSFRFPFERGQQLADFAYTHRLSMGDALGALLDHGAKTGLGNKLALPGIEITVRGDMVHVRLEGFELRPLCSAQAKSLAGDWRKAATTPGAGILDLDGPDIIETKRRGNGVAVRVERDGNTIIHRIYAASVAKGMADRLDDAAAQTMTKEEVEELVRDL
jgi:hypothetical protein